MISKGKSLLTPEKDNRFKLMNDRINFVEKHMGELCFMFGAYNRKLARFRDKHDELAKTFQSFSEEELFNKSTASALDSVKNGLTYVADAIDLAVQRIENKVIKQLTPFENVCRASRDSLKSSIVIHDKEMAREKQLMEIRNKFVTNSSAADSELIKAKLKVSRTKKEVEDIMETFEKRKIKDLKLILLDFIKIEMKHHAKVLEILTATYQDVKDIDEKLDLQRFQRACKTKSKPSLSKFKKHRSRSLESLGIPRSISTRSKNLSKSSRNLAADQSSDEFSDTDSSQDEDEASGTEGILAPDQDSSSETSESSESTPKNELDNLSASSTKGSKSSARVPGIKAFCDSMQIGEASTLKGTYGSVDSPTPRTIQVNTVNAIPKRP